MATTAVTKTLTKEIQADISRLLGRGRLAFKCPLDEEEQVSFWHNMLPPHMVEAYRLLESQKFDTSSLTTNKVHILTLDGPKRYQVTLHHPRGDHKFLSKDRYGRKFSARADSTMCAAMSAEKWQPFQEWMENRAIIDRDFIPALRTLEEVLGFCGTVGQMVRAIPDLHKYLPEEKQDLLRGQSRASNMPHAWHIFDRARIENLQFCMAKASIMPHTVKFFHEIEGTGACYHEA